LPETLSLPVRERGLKFEYHKQKVMSASRSPFGSVD